MNFSNNFIHDRVILFIVLLSFGCASSPRFTERSTRSTTNKPAPAGQAVSSESVSTTHTIKGKILLTLEGVASYYAKDFNGKQTSNGEMFDMNSLTAAHRTFPFGTKVRVINLDNNRAVVVRINDRGPFHEGRILDLSFGSAKELDVVRTGTAHVRLEVLEWGDGK